jgi:hypothetical protein
MNAWSNQQYLRLNFMYVATFENNYAKGFIVIKSTKRQQCNADEIVAALDHQRF